MTIAGSDLTMIDALKNMIKFTEVDMLSAVKMATLNPATVIGLARKKGSIKKGKDADLVIFDNKFKVKTTIVGGKVVYKKF